VTTKLLIADDHGVWRQGLRSLLEPAFRVVAEAQNGREAVAKSLSVHPDVVIMDIRLPDMDGLAAARLIKESLPATAVVILSAVADEDVVSEARLAGVSAYLAKDEPPEAIVDTVRKVAGGGAGVPFRSRRRTQAPPGAPRQSDPGVVDLSQREIAVLRLMAEGRRHKDVARRLKISPRTVGNYVASIYNKLGVNDRAEAIVYAIRKGLIRV
jgi:DNA-binding NarL/FixJ family response regulator